MAGFENDVMVAKNLNFDLSAAKPHLGVINAAGKIPIGTGNVQPSAEILGGSITSPDNSLTIGYSSPNITIEANGSMIGETITGNTGGALSPIGGNWNIVGTSTNGIQTSGSAATLTTRMQSPYADADFSFESQSGGTTRTLTVQNTVDAASSQATQLVKVAGTSSGDAWTQYSIGSTRSYAIGVDNSDSDRLKINFNASGSVNPSSGTTLQFFDSSGTTPGSQILVTGFSQAYSFSGDTVDFNPVNSSNTANSNCRINIQVGGTSAGDPYITYTGPTAAYSHGTDNSDSDKFKLTNGNGPSDGTEFMVCTTAGEITFPATPAFLGVLTSANDNVTGAGTSFTLGSGTALTEVFDQNSDFNTNGTFTAPVTGRYYLCGSFNCLNLTAAMTFAQCQIFTSNRAYFSNIMNPAAVRTVAVSADRFAFTMSVFADMDAGDIAVLAFSIGGGAGDTVDLESGSVSNYFSGFLQC